MSDCRSFPPVYREDALVLILGSMPGEASLRAGQYYAHPQNAFWRIQCALWGEAYAPDRAYADKLALLAAHRVALWDVAETCQREGSLDSGMRSVVCNDFAALFAAAPGIQAVFCNGGTAHALYLRQVFPGLSHIEAYRLPSTSPALTLPFAQKLEAWGVVSETVTRLTQNECQNERKNERENEK